MPELPEVETMCRGIAAIVGRQLDRLVLPPCAYRPISIRPSFDEMNDRLAGKVVERVSRLGKRVVIHIAQQVLLLQPKMSGLVVLEAPPDPEHVRLQMEFCGRPKLKLQFWDRRGLGTVELLHESELHSRVIAGRLGPDAMAIEVAEFCERVRATKRPIKVALLDQKLIAGIGNLYASEMLHVAGIHPQETAAGLKPRRLEKLFVAMRKILTTAIEHEGSTLSDGTYRNALNDPGRYQNQHLVYDRAGSPCSTCQRGEIQRIVQAQRSTFYCPRCQRLKDSP